MRSFWQSNATFLKLCFLFDMVYFVSLWKKARRVLHFGNAVKDLTIGDQTNRFNRLPVLLYRFCISTCNSTYNINIDHISIQDKNAILSLFAKFSLKISVQMYPQNFKLEWGHLLELLKESSHVKPFTSSQFKRAVRDRAS